VVFPVIRFVTFRVFRCYPWLGSRLPEDERAAPGLRCISILVAEEDRAGFVFLYQLVVLNFP
jgi:hypothetical protein